MSRKVATVDITVGFLEELLKLKGTDVKILRVVQEWSDEQRGVFKILIESDQLKEVFEGQVAPWVSLVYNQDTDSVRVEYPT